MRLLTLSMVTLLVVIRDVVQAGPMPVLRRLIAHFVVLRALLAVRLHHKLWLAAELLTRRPVVRPPLYLSLLLLLLVGAMLRVVEPK